ncbi:MAG: acetyltransferase [Candidatus Sericytochromatia bacterium]
MADIILFGVGTTAQVMHYHLSRAGHRVAAFTVDRAFVAETNLLGCPVVPFEELDKHFPPDRYQMMIAIGYVKLNQLRAERCEQARALGYRLFSFISPTAAVWEGLEAGEHCRIGEQTLIQPYTRLGTNVYVGSGCIVGHHSQLGDHCFLASRVTLGGGVVVEPYAFLGTGAIIRNKVRIGARSVVGAGAVILEDTREGGVYVAAGAEELDISSSELIPG